MPLRMPPAKTRHASAHAGKTKTDQTDLDKTYNNHDQTQSDKFNFANNPQHGLIPEDRLRALIDQYRDIVVHELPPGLPPDRDVPHTIPTEPNKNPPCKPMNRLSRNGIKEVQRQVTEVLACNYIKPITSPLCFLSKRKNGFLRNVLDY